MRFISFLAFVAVCEAVTFKLPITQNPRELIPSESSSSREQGEGQNIPWKQSQIDPFPSQRHNRKPPRKGPIGDIENDQYYGSYIRHSRTHHDTQSSTAVSRIPHLNDLTYSINITLGTPPQPLTLLVSISSPSLIIPSALCSAHSGCPDNLHRYNTSLSGSGSSTPGHHFSIPHFRFDGTAYRSTDTLNLLPGIRIPEQSFAQIVSYSSVLEPKGTWEGVLGLGPENAGNMLNPFQEMMRRGILDRNLFSLRLPQALGDTGEIEFGGIDANAFVGELKRLPLVQYTGSLSPNSRWTVSAQSLEMGSGFVSLSGYVAFLETDLPFIGLPADVVSLLDKHMGLESDNSFGIPSMDCANRHKLENLVITLGAEEFEISPWQYTLEINGDVVSGTEKSKKTCVSAFKALPDEGEEEKYIVLGTAFLRAFYGVFDLDERTVSLARATSQPSMETEARKDNKKVWNRFQDYRLMKVLDNR